MRLPLTQIRISWIAAAWLRQRKRRESIPPVHSGNLHIDFPGKMRYSWERRSRTSRKQRVIRAIAIRQTHLNRESTATRHSLSTKEVRKEKNPKQEEGKKQRRKRPWYSRGERGGWASAKSSLISLRCLKKMSAEICRAIHLVDDDTPSIEHTRFLIHMFVAKLPPASHAR